MSLSLHNPHAVLGLHQEGAGKIIRLFRPGAHEIFIEVQGQIVACEKSSDEGIFFFKAPKDLTLHDYRIYHENGQLAHDPYAFLPSLGEVDLHLFNQGVHYEIYNIWGAHCITHQGVEGVRFVVWAPNAKRVALVADYNFWNPALYPMRSMGGSGVWEIFVPGIKAGEKYKYEILTKEGVTLCKADPYAHEFEYRPKTASVVANLEEFTWTDQAWQEAKKHSAPCRKPINIYEVHLGSWKKGLNYEELGQQLAAYCKMMGFTHVELLPVMEHPLDESWGYQVTGFFAPTSRFGSPQQFQKFVDHMHTEGIAVILDWVPAHFPTDSFGLARFDGSCLYEYEDTRKGFHPDWNTLIFNYGRKEVINFLLGSALFWCEKMHADGLRVDAVASMLYLDYGRQEGQWLHNEYGGRENIEAIEFLKHLNVIIHEKCPGVAMFAEESTAFGQITTPVHRGGLGFDFKWNMGWMNDTLRYFTKDPIYRHYHQNMLTFVMMYAFSEKFLLPFSHDEVVHCKKSLLSKMPGTDWQAFAGLRLLLSYQICQVGKKLLFMGSELAMREEWCERESLPWHLLEHEYHRNIQKLVKDLNHFYQEHNALWELDDNSQGFAWIDFSDHQNSVISYLRKSPQEVLAVVHNFTPNYFDKYFIPLSNTGSVVEIFNTDNVEYGGSGKTNPQVDLAWFGPVQAGIHIKLAPLATMIFKVTFHN